MDEQEQKITETEEQMKKSETQESREKAEEKQDEKQAKLQEKVLEKDSKKENEEIKEKKPKFLSSGWHDKHYKLFLFISIAILVLTITVIGYTYFTTGDIMKKDVSLTGGTIITVHTSQSYDLKELSSFLQGKLKEAVVVRKLHDVSTGKQIGIFIESKTNSTILKEALEQYFNFELTEENSSIESISPSLSKSFFKELVIAVLLAFTFMTATVFILFKRFIPCVAVILAAITDVLGALAIANLFNFSISTAGIAALLMLIGYSIDTDIMLTTKVLKRREESLNSRIKSAFKTGVTMTLTSLVAVLFAYFIVTSVVLKQIFFILAAGLFIDLISTWFGNASILKWYCHKKNIA